MRLNLRVSSLFFSVAPYHKNWLCVGALTNHSSASGHLKTNTDRATKLSELPTFFRMARLVEFALRPAMTHEAMILVVHRDHHTDVLSVVYSFN